MPPTAEPQSNGKTTPMEQEEISGFCVLCMGTAYCVCQRCGDFYCSRICQKKDFQRHRYICFPIPPLVHPMASNVLATLEIPLPPEDVVQKLKACDINGNTNKEQVFKSSTMKTVPQQTGQMDIAAAVPVVNAALIVNDLNSVKKPLTKVANDNVVLPEPKQQQEQSVHNSSSISNDANGNVAKFTDSGKHVSLSSKCNSNSNLSTVTTKGVTPGKNNLKQIAPPEVDMLPNNSVVYVTGFRSPNRCFVRDASEVASKAYFSVCQKIHLLGRELPKMRKPRVYGYALARHNGLYQRVKVLSARGDHSARLLFLDHGLVTLRNVDEMLEISPELVGLPCYNLQIQLVDVPNYAIGDDINQFLSGFEGKKFTLINGRNDLKELVNVKTQKSLNVEIREFCANMQVFDQREPAKATKIETSKIVNVAAKTVEACSDKTQTEVKPIMVAAMPKPKPEPEAAKANTEVPEPAKQAVEVPEPTTKLPELTPREPPLESAAASSTDATGPVMAPPFEMSRFNSKAQDGIDIYIVDNSGASHGILGALDRNHSKDYSQLLKYLSDFNDSQHYEPVLHEYVLAKIQDDWGRAKVIAIDTSFEQYTVTYIDFTNTHTVTSKDIRRYPADLKLPCYTNVCLLEGFPHKPNAAQIAYLHEKLRIYNLLHIDSFTYLNGMAVIKSNQLIEELKQK